MDGAICKLVAIDPSDPRHGAAFDSLAPLDDNSLDAQIQADKIYGKLDDSNGELTYRLVDHDKELSRGKTRRGLNYALTAWDIEIKPSLQWVPHIEESDIEIRFRDAGDDKLFKDEPNVLAYMYYPVAGEHLKGKCVINKDYLWSINGERILGKDLQDLGFPVQFPDAMYQTWSLRKVIRHELGHGLGLPHSRLDGQTMSASYGQMADFNTNRDIARIVAKYGKRSMLSWIYRRWRNWYRNKFG